MAEACKIIHPHGQKKMSSVPYFILFDIFFCILYNIPMVLVLWIKKECPVMFGLFFTECMINREISNISILYFYVTITRHNKIV